METFFQAHAILVEHSEAPIRRSLMDTIDWSYRMIGIRGPRGVGRTSFLLQYAKEHYDVRLRRCLYVNMNNFYFQSRGIVDFAGRFVDEGGRVLLIDQAFKLQNWKRQLVDCYNLYPYLRIIYTTTPVDSGEEDDELSRLARTYVLHGFSFRDYVNAKTGAQLPSYSLEELLSGHEDIVKSILQKVKPWEYFQDYLHHGYYPFFANYGSFSEALLKAMNMMIEVDVLFCKQVELKYLANLKKLLYLLATAEESAPNVSRLAEAIGTSRATVMNYLKYLEEARLINMVYREGESFPKKPAEVKLHNTNLMYAVYSPKMDEQSIMETFFVNSLWRHNTVSKGRRAGYYRVKGSTDICVCDRMHRSRHREGVYYARYGVDVGRDNEIPIWLFGFLY